MTVQEFSLVSGLTEDRVRALCLAKNISSFEVNGELYLDEHEIETAKLFIVHPNLESKLLALTKNQYTVNHEIADYLCYHNAVDTLAWLIKLRYSAKEDIRKRSYRLDRLFSDFVRECAFDLPKISRLVGKEHSEDKFVFHLMKGWYNELVRAQPLDAETLKIGTSISGEYSNDRSISWNVIQSYYSIYEYINALVFTNTASLNTVQHRKSSVHFYNTLLDKFAGTLVRYPFSLTNPLRANIATLRGADKPFWKFQYAVSPRSKQSIFELEKDYVDLLSPEGNFLGVLYSFRIWANYLGIDTIIRLQDGFYLSYLYKNLSIVTFFHAALSEIMALAFLGESRTIQLVDHITHNHILRQKYFEKSSALVPLFIRLRLYHKHGLISSLPSYVLPLDPIEI